MIGIYCGIENTNSDWRLNELQNVFFKMEEIQVQVFRSAT